jgi:hypothetical protein
MENNANNTGWIKLHRKFLEWEWWEEPNMVRMFLTLLLTANTEDKRWKGITIHRGQLVTSLSRLMIITCMSRKCVRTALLRLQKTNEIVVTRAQNFSIITICNYATYQDREVTQGHTKGTQKGLSTAQQGADDRHNGGIATDTEGVSPPTQQGAPTKEIKNNNISTTPARACTCVSVEELAAWLKYKSGGIWKETAMMQLGVKSRGALELMFEDFQRECIAQGVTEKEERDIQPHFMAQMRIRQRKEKENAKIERNNGRGDSRPTKAERDAEFVTYINGLMGGGTQGNLEVGGEPDGDI